MARWVVLVKPPDDHPGWSRIMGPFRDRAAAEELERKIRNAVNAAEDAHMGDVSDGYAYVIELEEPRVRRALSWALRGER